MKIGKSIRLIPQQRHGQGDGTLLGEPPAGHAFSSSLEVFCQVFLLPSRSVKASSYLSPDVGHAGRPKEHGCLPFGRGDGVRPLRSEKASQFGRRQDTPKAMFSLLATATGAATWEQLASATQAPGASGSCVGGTACEFSHGAKVAAVSFGQSTRTVSFDYSRRLT